MPTLGDMHLDQEQAAKYVADQYGLPISPKTLNTMRTRGGGPRKVKWGRRTLYRQSDLDAWVDERLGRPHASTSEAA